MTANTLQMAVKGKEPVVSIQVPSDRPIFIRRKVLKTAIAGMVIQTVELHKDAHSGHRYIRVRGIDGKSPRIRRYYAFRDMDATQAHKLMSRYNPNPKPRQSARQKQIERLKTRLAYYERRPFNPAVASGYRLTDEYRRKRIAAWYQQKPFRRLFNSRNEFHSAIFSAGCPDWVQTYNPIKQYLNCYEPAKWGAIRYKECGWISAEAKELREMIASLEALENSN